MALEQLRSPTLAETAAQALREAIVSGALKPGKRLVEQKLAHSLGTSQPTVREALKELQNQGYVHKVAKKGTYVTQLSQEDAAKIHEIRLLLEAFAIERAAPNVTTQTLQSLGLQVSEMAAAAEEVDRERFHAADMRFHREIWALTDNKYLTKALEQVTFSLFAFMLLTQNRESFLAAVEHHQLILEGLATKDPEQAREAFLKITANYWRVLLPV